MCCVLSCDTCALCLNALPILRQELLLSLLTTYPILISYPSSLFSTPSLSSLFPSLSPRPLYLSISLPVPHTALGDLSAPYARHTHRQSRSRVETTEIRDLQVQRHILPKFLTSKNPNLSDCTIFFKCHSVTHFFTY